MNQTETPASLLRYIETRDKRCTKSMGWPKSDWITELWAQLVAGKTVRVGGRSTCGGKVDPSWVIFCAWNEVIRKAQSMGYRVTVTPIKADNAWATKAGGFWDENAYALA